MAEGVEFQCRAPGAFRVFLAGDFNGFAHNRNGRIEDTQFAMKGPDSNGVFRKTVVLAPGLYRYKFAIEGAEWTWFAPEYELQRDQGGNAYLVVSGSPDPAPRAVGARTPWIEKGMVHFELFAPEAYIVYLAGSFNNWADNHAGRVMDLRYVMRGPDAHGIWHASLPLGRGRHEYQFVINGNTWIIDPLSSETTTDQHSVVEVR